VSSEGGLPAEDGPPSAAEIEDEPTRTPALDFSDPDRLIAAIEAILFVVEAPVSVAALATAVECPTIDVEAALARLATVYDDPSRGIELRWIADGVRIYTRPALASAVEAFLLDGQRTKLSQAALETLAVIAYRQPVSRGRISAIRGVNVDGVVRTLVSRGLIVEEGLDPDSGAGLFRTTSIFLEKMGLQSVSELPSLAPLLPEIDSLETDEL
jgi:segregation and condensation protein B